MRLLMIIQVVQNSNQVLKNKKIIQDPFLIQLVDCLLQRISNFLSPFSRKKDRKEIKLVFAKSGTFH